MNGERTETFLPGIHRADYNFRQRCLMTLPKWSLFTRFVCSSCQPYRFLFPTVIHFISGCILQFIHSVPLPDNYRLFISALCSWESFFCEVTLDLANCKACLVNNLPLGNECLKRILHASLALFALSALLKAEKSSRHTAERL